MRKLPCTLVLLTLLASLAVLPATAEAAPARVTVTASPDNLGFEVSWLRLLERAMAWLLPLEAGQEGKATAPGSIAAATSTGEPAGGGSDTQPGDPSDQAGEMIDPNG